MAHESVYSLGFVRGLLSVIPSASSKKHQHFSSLCLLAFFIAEIPIVKEDLYKQRVNYLLQKHLEIVCST